MLQEFDWKYTLKFLYNRNQFLKQQTSIQDSKERFYKIKILLKEFPTYDVLYKRKANFIDNNVCVRCNLYERDWYHMYMDLRI